MSSFLLCAVGLGILYLVVGLEIKVERAGNAQNTNRAGWYLCREIPIQGLFAFGFWLLFFSFLRAMAAATNMAMTDDLWRFSLFLPFAFFIAGSLRRIARFIPAIQGVKQKKAAKLRGHETLRSFLDGWISMVREDIRNGRVKGMDQYLAVLENQGFGLPDESMCLLRQVERTMEEIIRKAGNPQPESGIVERLKALKKWIAEQ